MPAKAVYLYEEAATEASSKFFRASGLHSFLKETIGSVDKEVINFKLAIKKISKNVTARQERPLDTLHYFRSIQLSYSLVLVII